MDKLLNVTLKQDKNSFGVQDGMDLSLLKMNKVNNELIISTARRPFVLIQKGQLRDFKGGKYSLGGLHSGEKTFEETKLQYENGDMLYFFTDGYGDQFGGENGKKFSTKRLRDLFHAISSKEVLAQKEVLDEEISKWKGSLEQVDDICVIGIRL